MEIITSIQVCFIYGWTLVIWTTLERKAFVANPKHQYHVSQWGEQVYGAHSQKNEDYYDNPSLSHSMNEF